MVKTEFVTLAMFQHYLIYRVHPNAKREAYMLSYIQTAENQFVFLMKNRSRSASMYQCLGSRLNPLTTIATRVVSSEEEEERVCTTPLLNYLVVVEEPPYKMV
jgi:hypothetical protein